MGKIYGFLFSSRLMVIIVIIFALSIATATFIENDFGSQTARAVIYNSWWFSLLLLLGIVNLTGTMLINKMYRKEKFTLFLFHIAFLFILTGSAITHFFGFEGYMHIRAGQSSNRIVSENTFLQGSATINGQTAFAEKHIYVSALSENDHKLKLRVAGKVVNIECSKITPDAIEKIADDPNGEPVIELVMADSSGKQTVLLSSGQTKKIGNLQFSFNDTSNIHGINIVTKDGDLQIKSPFTATVMSMATQIRDTMTANIYHPFLLRTLYSFGRIQVVAKSYNPTGRIEVETAKDAAKDEYPDALYFKVSSEGISKSVIYFARPDALNEPTNIRFNNLSVVVGFGAKEVQIPFFLQLNEFILKRYPGSNSPSWFESQVMLNDSSRGVHQVHRIFMNNVMKYRGFRFFQSSYDPDELGTILSVNYDYWGTMVTYFGYLMLALGIVLSLFNRNSRFRKLSSDLSRLRESRKKITSIVVMFMISIVSMPLFAQMPSTIPDSVFIDKVQAAKFGHLLIQDPHGRIKPMNSLSSELLRKICRKTEFLGQTSDQVLLGMLVYPDYWQSVPMILISHPEIQKILHTSGSYVSFSNVIDRSLPKNPYLLNDYVNEAFQKKPGSRSTFDNEIIRLDERVNLCYQIYNGDLLRIFPKRSDPSQTWYSPANSAKAFTGKDSVFVASILPIYLRTLKDATTSKDLSLPNETLGLLNTFQAKFGSELIPSPFKIRLEILYNHLNIFDTLGSLYGLIGFILLIFQFITIFAPKLNLKGITVAATIAILLCFIAHLAGLVARWYISGHAPWSNAYESLVYIAFATILAGILFSRKSGITLSVTALLAWLILFVAHLNWMDPEITNLVPVLKSYWLLIHVAIITASYGFLALGALLAFINLIMMISQSPANIKTTGSMIAELSIVIEMTLIVGLYMITIGMFLGGVWANESWGRYWGWDSKETWALVSVLVYAFITHMRMVPGLKSTYIFNLMSLLGFSSIIMTYFGVNYYLSGLHSYAKGDPIPVPSFVYYTIVVIVLVALTAWINQKRLRNLPIKHGS